MGTMGNSTLITFVVYYCCNTFVTTCVSMLSVGVRVVMYFHAPFAVVL